MAKDMEVQLILTGANAGRTMRIRDMDFVKGVGYFSGTPEAVQGRVTYMGRCYSAYPAGSRELEAAQRRDEDGLRNSDDQKAGGGRDGVSVQNPPQEGNGATGEGGGASIGAVVEGGRSDSDKGLAGDGAGLAPDRVGHSNAGVSQRADEESRRETDPVDGTLTLYGCLKALSHDDDEAWTGDGRPALLYMQVVTGNPRLTRADLDSAYPGWNRRAAAQAAGAPISA